MTTNGPSSTEQLRLFIERIERLEEDKKGIADDIKDVYSEAKGTGFDTKTMRAIIALRKMDPAARREAEALLDTYRAALGMLDGTPLGRWAAERLDKDREPDAPNDEREPGDDDAHADAPPAAYAAPPVSTDDARVMGRDAARGGRPVTSNPFPPRDPNRAAWDEAWCGELGSDGMDIPDALKPTPKSKKSGADDAAGGAA